MKELIGVLGVSRGEEKFFLCLGAEAARIAVRSMEVVGTPFASKSCHISDSLLQAIRRESSKKTKGLPHSVSSQLEKIGILEDVTKEIPERPLLELKKSCADEARAVVAGALSLIKPELELEGKRWKHRWLPDVSLTSFTAVAALDQRAAKGSIGKSLKNLAKYPEVWRYFKVWHEVYKGFQFLAVRTHLPLSKSEMEIICDDALGRSSMICHGATLCTLHFPKRIGSAGTAQACLLSDGFASSYRHFAALALKTETLGDRTNFLIPHTIVTNGPGFGAVCCMTVPRFELPDVTFRAARSNAYASIVLRPK